MAAEYKVLKATQLTRVSDAGGLETYYKVQIKTKGKMVLFVDIDGPDFNPEKAAPILLAKAIEADKVLTL